MSNKDALNKEAMFEELAEICESKAEEFAMLGYDNVTGQDIWDCVFGSYKEIPLKHKLVNDILSLKPNKYMNWLMINMYKNSGSI
ncbi:post-transcriptional regulator [Brevibacillus sp. SYSU BS000544]|uniref:post-transcriptional regulator n=1 Tax=Brevibacillus sp. SYSU BS000544 TaxID=3416443 RepID=UPI003CE5098E